MSGEQSIAVLMTCHNRKDTTLACLETLFLNSLPGSYRMDVFLVDDGSTDGTGDAIKEIFSSVNVIRGDGSLFWNGGMRVAFQAAMDKGYDYFLWLNDDTVLFKDALKRLLSFAKPDTGILIGSTVDENTKEQTYGGVVKGGVFNPLRFSLVEPDESELVSCDTFNGNCVLISKQVVNQVGNLSAEFTHGIGDFDYGLRAKALGIHSFVAAGFYGECSRNPAPKCFDKHVSLKERMKALHSPKGLPPKDWYVFTKRHAPFLCLTYMVKLYFNIFKPR